MVFFEPQSRGVIGKTYIGDVMLYIKQCANELGTTIDSFFTEASSVRSDTLTWLANGEHITTATEAGFHQLRILLQDIDTHVRRVANSHRDPATEEIFTPDRLQEAVNRLQPGVIDPSDWQIAVSTITVRGFPHYLDEVMIRISRLDRKLEETQVAIPVWNASNADSTAAANLHLALDGVNQVTTSLQSFIKTGMMIVEAVIETQTADA